MEGEAVVLQIVPEETNHPISFTMAIQRTLSDIFDPVVTRLRGLFVPLREIAFGLREEGVIMPQSAFNFIITGLLALAEIKSQGNTKFPFESHPKTVMVSVTSFLMYGFSSAVEHFISATQLGPNSVYAFIARLGRIASLCILVVSLASLFYF